MCAQKVENHDSENLNRGQWASKTEFILSCLGYAIGIGNVWRFPYLCYRNGGGAFLIPYLLMLFFCGIPLFFMETCLGQFASTGCISMFKITPIFKGVGIAIMIVNLVTLTYFNIIIAYPVIFMLKSWSAVLPWQECNNQWNTINCIQITSQNNGANHTNQLPFKTPADEFFHNEILKISSGIDNLGGIVWSVFWADLLVWVIVYFCIMKGVKSVGKVVYFTATFPFIILAILLVRGVTLPGAMDGIKFYLMPKWSELLNLKVWADAALQIFFSLGPGWGGIVNMASYNPFRNNTKWDSIIVPVVNSATSIFAGFVVFSVLGFMSFKTGQDIDKVATGGPGLSFVTMPLALTMMPFPQLWSFLFFFMLFLLGLDTVFVQLEAVLSSIMDECQMLRSHKSKVFLVSIFLIFIASIPCTTEGGMYVLQLLDWYAASISVILICFLELLCVCWFYGIDRFVRDIEFMLNAKLHWWWQVCWKYITPTILMFIFVTSIIYNSNVTYNGVSYPKWSITCGWLLCLTSITAIPTYMLYKLLITRGSLKKRIAIGLTSQDWGPSDAHTRQEWIDHVAEIRDR
ncbi:sodium- and chloride-dependent glycine transporter 1-like [Bradysia coprophila]|uniref:sodium- and chloride-dependent glycine transporter 1-like n=1 Tax=Bradysia coprophila TaxID=38358 RepID=UPI00187DBB07|nr:sodium- and chloride-dependent glycine transporter 1-like [Bradysia coprophila]